jgi:transcriptional regulator with XRE-family HTH domain
MTSGLNKIGQILRELRKSRQMTQADVSNLIQTDRSNVANYEKGRRLPPINTAIVIAQFFNVSLDYLILGKKSKSNNFFTDKEDETYKTLMAENTLLMDGELKFHEIVSQKDQEIQNLKRYINILESKHKKKNYI